MKEQKNAVDVRDASHPLGSVSVLSFLYEASRDAAYRDPIEAMYEAEPTITKQSLSEIYTVNSVEENLLQVEKRNTEFRIAKSFDLSFARLMGAAYVAASYSTIPDIDLRGGQHAAYTRKRPSVPLTPQEDLTSGPSQEVRALFDFWSAFDPCFDLVREIKVAIPTESAQDLLDFDVMAEAMETGALSSRAKSVEKITPKISALESIGAILKPDTLDHFLEMLCGPFGSQSDPRGDIRFQFTDNAMHAKLIPYGVSNPFLETLLSKLFVLTPDACEDEEGQTWYLPGDSDIYDLYLPNDEQLEEFATDERNIYDMMMDKTGADIISDLPDERVPIPPSLILAGACRNQNALSFSYAEVATVAGLVSGANVWGNADRMINKITVIYDTLGKLSRRRYCHFNEEADYSLDEYVTERLPVDAETAEQMVKIAELSETERSQDVASVRPGITQEDLRVGAGYLSVDLTEPAELLCRYLTDTHLDTG